MKYTKEERCEYSLSTTHGIKSEGGRSGSPLLHGGLVAGDGLGCVHTPAKAVHALKVWVAQRCEGRYPPRGVEGKELHEKSPSLLIHVWNQVLYWLRGPGGEGTLW